MKSVLRAATCLLLCTLIFFAALVPAAAAGSNAHYYVSATGNDKNSGSAAAPFRTLEKALTKARAGVTISLRAGDTFRGGELLTASGTAKNPITIDSYGKGSKPVIRVDGDENVLRIVDVEHWIFRNLCFTAPNGKGVNIYANLRDCAYLDFYSCDFIKISPVKLDEISTSLAAIHVDNSRKDARVHNILFDGITVRDCAYGFHSKGISVESNPEKYVSPKASYNYNITFRNSVFERAYYGAVIFGSVRDCLVTNCFISGCAGKAKFACAAIWMHHSDNVMVEHCEVCNSRNVMDGMTIDFDGWTTNSTYQYIYSHDNSKFMKNCLYDNTTKNRNNTVRYCLSVNDNRSFSAASFTCISTSNPDFFPTTENFTFEHNTLIHSGPVRFGGLTNSQIKNNLYIDSVALTAVGRLGFNRFEGNITCTQKQAKKLIETGALSMDGSGCGNVTFCRLRNK